MCGIVGIVTRRPAGLEPIIRRMNDALVHRGPDDEGTLVRPDEGVALAMRRLSIIDITGGHQPMCSEDGGHAVVFNGEIYNHAALRDELSARGHRFATDHSDTEVLVHGYEEWGEALFPRLNGMFACAIWDRDHRRLVVARDRTGEKPLYIARLDGGFAIASELKALLRHPEVRRDIDPVAVEQFLAFDYVLAPRTPLLGVSKLPAAHYAEITGDACHVRPYWTMRFPPERLGDEHEVLERLDTLLDQAVRSRMVADVPIGLFLSGGLDSTTVGWYMSRHSADVRSFSIGFDDPRFDETEYARMAARHLGTTHHLEVFSEDRVMDLVPRVTELLDEPMADQSIFPTHLLSAVARRHVKVALGGDGSDELLMGYRSYMGLKAAWMLDPLPHAVRRGMSALARGLPSQVGSVRLRGKRFAERLERTGGQRLIGSLGSFNGDARWVLSQDIRRQLPASVFDGLDPIFTAHPGALGGADLAVAAYVRAYLQEDILVKVDRASMATSLEVRAPFLDPELIDFLAAVSPDLKMRRMTGKHALRRLMRGRIPDAVIDRRKRGFGVPINAWLRSSLAPLLSDHLTPRRLTSAGIFDAGAVSTLVREHLEGTHDRGQQLWPILLFEMWRDHWLTRTAAAPPPCVAESVAG